MAKRWITKQKGRQGKQQLDVHRDPAARRPATNVGEFALGTRWTMISSSPGTPPALPDAATSSRATRVKLSLSMPGERESRPACDGAAVKPVLLLQLADGGVLDVAPSP
jgi:hypothetical protein